MVTPKLLRGLLEHSRRQHFSGMDEHECDDYGRALGALLLTAIAAARDLGLSKAAVIAAVDSQYDDRDRSG